MKVKGSVLLARRAFVERHFGAGAWERVLAALPAEDRAALRGMVLHVGWFPFRLGESLDATIVRVLGDGQASLFEQIGRTSARENLAGAHKSFLVPGDPQKFLAQTGEIYSFYYDTGRRSYQASGPTSGVMTTYDADAFSAPDCLTVIGWHKEALAQCGARDVRITEETCRARGGEYCRYRLEWSP